MKYNAKIISTFQIELFSNLYHLIDEAHESVAHGESQDHFNITGEHPLTLQQWTHQHVQHVSLGF